MIKRTLIAFLLTTSVLHAKVGDNIFIGETKPQEIVVNNRVLANVNGKLISVVDVMKKMDVMFYQQFPEYVDNTEARYQFYQFQWKRTLKDLIDKELIMADAEENKLPVSSGDVRQEMEYLFGPNILVTLDKIGMSFDQAMEMLRGDIILRRMMYLRVNMKAQRRVTPQTVRDTYEKLAEENRRPASWNYQFVTVRHPNPEVGAKTASKTLKLLKEEVSLGELNASLEKIGADDQAKITVSDEFAQTEKEVNPAYLKELQKLSIGSYSKPIEQKSRDNSIVYRIFHLKAHDTGGVVPFFEVEKKIHDKLMDEAINEETDKYLKKLRQHYGVSDTQLKEMIDEGFEPFQLRS